MHESSPSRTSPQLARRGFVLGACGWAFGCRSRPEPGRVGSSGDAGASMDAGIAPCSTVASDLSTADGFSPADAGTCVPTLSNPEGPFFTPGSPERSLLYDGAEMGSPLRLSGSVTDAACTPLDDVVVDFWHADASGAYDNEGFDFRGRVRTGAGGRYEVTSIVPGRYLDGAAFRPAHVHVKVVRRSVVLLTTQIYFPGDSCNARDGLYRPELVASVTRSDAGVTDARFDFVLSGV